MDRLYLIRVDMERFLGPFNLKQLKDAYSRMEFGLQDEISGSLRQWVSFDDIEGIRRHYPELAQLVQTEMLSGWGLSAHTVPPLASSKVKMPRKKSSKGLFWPLILLFAVILGGGGFLYRQGDFGDLLSFLKDRNLHSAQSLYGDQYNPRFESHMDRNRDAINLAMKKKKGLIAWIPYVRAVAFERDGQWEGATAKKLRGKTDDFLPQDCSLSYWESVWNASRGQWSRYLDGAILPDEDWSLLLALDPHWVRNRSPMNGWLRPGSYHEACLQIALKALQRQNSSNTPWEAKVFIARLRWQLGVINAQVLNEEFQMSGTLWALSCVEDSPDDSELRNCLTTLNLKTAWKNYFERVAFKRRIDLLLRDAETLDEAKLNLFTLLVKEFSQRAEGSPWSYAEDLRFYTEIIQQQGRVKQARSIMEQRLPLVRFE